MIIFYYYVLHGIIIFIYLCYIILLVLAYSMKSIVVYITIFLSCLLFMPGNLQAQKRAIDLISSHHQYRHPEAIIDTGYAVTPPVGQAVFKDIYYVQPDRTIKKKKKQIGPSLDSLFQKEEEKAPSREKSPAKTTILFRKFNPLTILFKITALK